MSLGSQRGDRRRPTMDPARGPKGKTQAARWALCVWLGLGALLPSSACHGGRVLRTHRFASGEAGATTEGFWVAPTSLEITDRSTRVGLRLYNDSEAWLEIDLEGLLLITDDATYPVLGYGRQGEELRRRSLTLAPGEHTEIMVLAEPTHPPLEALRLESRAQRRGDVWLAPVSVQLSTPPSLP